MIELENDLIGKEVLILDNASPKYAIGQKGIIVDLLDSNKSNLFIIKLISPIGFSQSLSIAFSRDNFIIVLDQNIESLFLKLKQYGDLYFHKPTDKIDNIYSFLLGWEVSSNIKITHSFITYLSKIKQTGAKIPDEENLTFEEAFDFLIKFLEEKCYM